MRCADAVLAFELFEMRYGYQTKVDCLYAWMIAGSGPINVATSTQTLLQLGPVDAHASGGTFLDSIIGYLSRNREIR